MARLHQNDTYTKEVAELMPTFERMGKCKEGYSGNGDWYGLRFSLLGEWYYVNFNPKTLKALITKSK